MPEPAGHGVVASVLCVGLVDSPDRTLRVVHRAAHAAQLADDSGRVVCCVMNRRAVRLPSAIVLPDGITVPSSISVGDGAVTIAGVPQPVVRWFRPARPRTPPVRGRVDVRAISALAREVPELIGLGPGLTPYGDDVVSGALVACRAAAPGSEREIVAALARLDLEQRTTATSAHLVRAAAHGWCVDPVADYLVALAGGGALEPSRQALLSLGRTSGAGVLEGIHRVFRAEPDEVAA